MQGVSLSLQSGASLALVGASGAGKSTLARLISGWEQPDTGAIRWTEESEGCRVQMVPQDPGPSLNPWLTALEAASEPLAIQRRDTSAAREMLLRCEVPPALFSQRTARLSGGQKARVAIARALAARPRLLILDETFTSLDLITRKQLTRIVLKMQSEYGLAMVWVLHDLDYAGQVAADIAVMDGGRIVERDAPRQLALGAAHAVTKALLSARPDRSLLR